MTAKIAQHQAVIGLRKRARDGVIGVVEVIEMRERVPPKRPKISLSSITRPCPFCRVFASQTNSSQRGIII
ncbi:hypothetical protein GWC77_23555 [Paraburkholderia sp. NMBU_R16]|uniref:hypothetical protein n=1 Tax=Paraburkholderia sp. NMBU_R16 TaxID=2698676 RepID=UPI001563324C|nr:hypothetical protein [Paraburkholderia sp. NMBU_R16]NRO98889.1 hypothetical protein [Paraburkholderia sp. NMBU_R16]